MDEATLSTARLRLRLLDGGGAADRRLYRALYTSADVMAWIASPLSESAADAAFDRVCVHNLREVPGNRCWVIQQRQSDAGLGIAALTRDAARAEIGIMLLPAFRGSGVSRETFSALLPHAFDTMGLERVDAERADDWQATVIDRLLTPFGFQRAVARRPRRARWVLTRSVWQKRVPVGICTAAR